MGSYSNLHSYWDYNYSGGKTTRVNWHINSSLYNSLTVNDPNGIRDNDVFYLDRVIGNALTKMLLMTKINYEFELPTLISRGLTELSDGVDDRLKNEIIELANNTKNLSNFSISNNRVDMGIKSTDSQDSAVGYMLLRYLAKQEIDPTNVGDTTTPPDALVYNGHSYYLYSGVASTWEEAKKYCQSLGGHLAVINDSAENTALFNYMKSKGYSSAYFGLSDAITEGNWQWVDGSSVTYTNWASGEPGNGYGTEDYAMFYWKFTNGKWNDGDFDVYTDRGGKAFICEWDTVRQDDNIKIDEATALEVINLFKVMDAAEKKTTLKENLATLESLKTIVEGDKKIEIKDEETGKSYFTDSKNLIETLKACYDDDAPEWLTEYTKYVHDFKGHIVYKSYYLKDQDGHFIYDSEGNPIRFFELDANNNRIPVEYNSKLRDAASNTLGITFDIYSASESIEKLLYEDLNGVQKTAEISKLSGNIVSITGAIRQLGDFDKAGTIAPIASAFLGLTGSIISLCDGVTAEEVVDVVQKALEFSTITAKYALTPEFATTKIGTLLGGNSFVTTKLKLIAESFNTNAIKVNLGVAVALGLVMGGVQYFKSNEQYQIDGLKNSQAIKDKWTDAFTTGMKTFYNTVTLGLDDAAFGMLSAGATNAVYGIEWIWTAITGGDVSKVKKMSTGGKNYMELFGDFLKLVFLNQYTDPNTNGDENGYMENTKVGRNIYSGGGNDSINNKASKANIYSATGNDVIFCSEGTNQQYIDGGNDNDHIALYGSSNEIHGGLGDDQIDIFGDSKNPSSGNYILGEAGNDYIWIGDGKSKKTSSTANSIDGGTGDDVIFIDQTKIPNIIFYNSGDGNDEIFGYDSNDQIRINKSDYTTRFDGDDVKIIVGSGSMTLYDAKDKKLNITKTDIDIMPTGMTADKNKTTLTISNKFKMQNIYLENYNESFTKVNTSGLAKTQPIEINGNSSSNSIKGGKGDDTLRGNDGNDTLAGGSGSDLFVYEKGNDVITDYKTGEDKIKLNPSSIISSTLKGSDVILTTSNGTLTIKATKDKVITFVDNIGKTTDIIFFGNTFYEPLAVGLTYDAKRVVLTANNKFTGKTIDLGKYLGTVTKVNASATSQSLNIIGNGENNSIKGGKSADKISEGNGKDTIFGGAGNDSIYGGTDNDKLQGDAGNDTLYGRSGNDTLTGGAGNDVFVYEGGNDLITDYSAGQDSIKVNGSISNVSYSGKNVIFSIGSGSLTVNNAKGKNISVSESNGSSHTYSRTLDLFYDNKFLSDDFNLDSVVDISDTNYSVGKIYYSSNNNEFTANSIIAASSDFK